MQASYQRTGAIDTNQEKHGPHLSSRKVAATRIVWSSPDSPRNLLSTPEQIISIAGMRQCAERFVQQKSHVLDEQCIGLASGGRRAY